MANSTTNIDLLPLSQKEIEHYTNYWCRCKGIRAKDLTTHPYIKDVVILIQWRDHFWNKANKSEQHHWSVLWNIVYESKRPAAQSKWEKLHTQTENIISKQQQLETQRQTIKALRKASVTTIHKEQVHNWGKSLLA